MKLLLVLAFALSISAQPLVIGELFNPSENESLLLISGIATCAVNDSGATVTFDHGELHAKASRERLFVTLPDGIVTINGTVRIFADTATLSFQVFDGYIRFLSSGGYPGETVTTGYVRTLSRLTFEGERQLIHPSMWEEFCKKNEDGQYTFGCKDTVIEDILFQEPAGVTNTPVIFHEPVWQMTVPHNFNRSLFLNTLIEHINSERMPITPIFSPATDYSTVWEMERSGTPFQIIDIILKNDESRQNGLTAVVTLYQSSSQKSSSFTINSTFKTTYSQDGIAQTTVNASFFDMFINFFQKNVP